jgi:hypothetical protein
MNGADQKGIDRRDHGRFGRRGKARHQAADDQPVMATAQNAPMKARPNSPKPCHGWRGKPRRRR